MRHPVSRLRARALAVGLSALTALALLPSASAGAADPYRWAALGDSYTSGLFVGDPTPALGNVSRDGCDRTTGTYPDLVARELAQFPPGQPVQLTDVSCGGADIGDVAEERQQPLSPVQAPGGDPANWPEVAPQVQRAGLDGTTDVVTIGVGGNSLPFAAVLGKCAELGLLGRSCQEYYTNPPAGEESIGQKLARVEREYVEMLAEVHQAAPNAKVITVGYPAVLPQDGNDCTRLNMTQLGTVRAADIDWLRVGVLEPLNRTIARVSSFFGDRYVDLYSSSVDHHVCKPAGTKWVEGICGDAADHWPAALTRPVRFDCSLLGKRITLVHPNAAGHANAADHVERAIRIALLDR
ncbi:SGNH/GDSL hydrolase family protein [Streptomyces thermolilacinus]|uniref:Hydrolytic protein n=1 Tax=Streptomyces thermolilacinus SPC6 TaxID=1306406 RepID=A0A1D3DTP9_9ACTN|nr:SGNH/GDSL hydrolase family protein [Streptomyces thermolilacinus]OEJ95700.1 hydrolytic protein [Streptomyces thermolilacinus SPC6]